MKALVEAGANVAAANRYGETPLEITERNQNFEIVAFLRQAIAAKAQQGRQAELVPMQFHGVEARLAKLESQKIESNQRAEVLEQQLAAAKAALEEKQRRSMSSRLGFAMDASDPLAALCLVLVIVVLLKAVMGHPGVF